MGSLIGKIKTSGFIATNAHERLIKKGGTKIVILIGISRIPVILFSFFLWERPPPFRGGGGRALGYSFPA